MRKSVRLSAIPHALCLEQATIAKEIATNAEDVAKYAEQLEFCVRNGYEPTEFVAGPAEAAALLTCRHLVVGEAGVGRFYPKCRIGGPEERRRFVLARASPAATG